jgi:hypothetical protein
LEPWCPAVNDAVSITQELEPTFRRITFPLP